MPALWSKVTNSEVYEHGVDISEAAGITNVQGVQPAVWVPDIAFPDAVSIVRTQQYLKLYPTGELRHLEHLVLKLSQSTMDYHNYPCDIQNVTLSFYSFTLLANQLIFQPYEVTNTDDIEVIVSPVDLIYPQGSSTAAMNLNPIWQLLSTAYEYTTGKLSPGLSERPFGIISFRIKRRSTGILKRLCTPILLIMLLCAASYWSTINDRISITVTGLLAIAALYIALVETMPLVGYLTRMDYYMLIMFIIVFVNCILHMCVIRLNVVEKGSFWPLRKLSVRLIEFFGRLTMIPWIILTYTVCFWPAIYKTGIIIVLLLVSIYEYIVCWRYLPELRDTILSTVQQIEQKQQHKGSAKNKKMLISRLELQFLRIMRVFYSTKSDGSSNSSSNNEEKHNNDAETLGTLGMEVEMQSSPQQPYIAHTTTNNSSNTINNSSRQERGIVNNPLNTVSLK